MTLCLSLASTKETFNERLKFWTLKNDFNLLSFEFDFKIPIQHDKEQNLLIDETGRQVDYFPRPVLDLFDEVTELERVDVNLVQGRWNQNLMPRVMKYEIDPDGVHRKMAEGFEHREPGFSMSTDSIGSLSESST